MNTLVLRGFLVVVLSANPRSAAASPPAQDDVAAALATIASQLRSQPSDDLLESIRAGDLRDLAAQLQSGTRIASIERKSACLRTQIELPLVLKKLRDAAVTELRGRPATSVTLAAIDPMFWDQVRELVHVQVDPTSEALRIVATGVGAASGEEWIISATGPATRTKRGCEEAGAPDQTAAPSEEEIVRALATLSKTIRPTAKPRADLTTLTRVVVGVVGATAVLYSTDEQKARLRLLAKRVRAAGGDLVPILQPQFDEVEQDQCASQTELVSDRLSQLIIADLQGDKLELPETVGHYVIDRLGKWKPDGYHDFIARGTGPMKGDVWTTERGYPTSKTDFCSTRKAPSIIK